MLIFNLLKYYIILLRQFKMDITPGRLEKTYPNKKWEQYCKGKQYEEIVEEVNQDICRS